MNNRRNIILIGKTGNGKSTIANVLSDSNHFTEDSSNTSCLDDFKYKDFSFFNGIDYRIIDTPGIIETTLIPKKTIKK